MTGSEDRPAGGWLNVTPALLTVWALTTAGCDAGSNASSTSVSRDTLPDGTVVVRYAALDPEPVAVGIDLTIGARGGDPDVIFGDVRGIDAALDGTIYVLDYQASEVRAFGPDGGFLGVVASKGEGPGEITEANGILLVGDTLIWIQDHAKWMMVGVDRDGVERARMPMHVLSYGYVWSGTIDDAGRLWKGTSHSDDERTFPPEEGLTTGSARSYLKSYDPATDRTDSVYLGEPSYRTYIARSARGGWSYRGIPFDPAISTVVDPAGGFWRTETGAYRIARLDESGDTTIVIEVDVERVPVTQLDRDAYVAEVTDREPGDRRLAEAVAALMPESKPVISDLLVDDRGRLWVERTRDPDARPRYDVFDRTGDYRGSIILDFEPDEYFPIRVRNGRIYARQRDELDVPSVVRSEPFTFGGRAATLTPSRTYTMQETRPHRAGAAIVNRPPSS